MNKKFRILIQISLKSVPNGLINNNLALVYKMAWRRKSDKPLTEPSWPSSPTYICSTRGRWVLNTGVFSIFVWDISSLGPIHPFTQRDYYLKFLNPFELWRLVILLPSHLAHFKAITNFNHIESVASMHGTIPNMKTASNPWTHQGHIITVCPWWHILHFDRVAKSLIPDWNQWSSILSNVNRHRLD